MNLLFMAEGLPVTAIVIDDVHGKQMADYVEQYNKFCEAFVPKSAADEDQCPGIVEWLNTVKGIPTRDLDVEVISMVDGYWYT